MWVRPIKPGISISQAGFGAATGGTLGCFVQEVATGKIMLLGNMHVLQFFQSAPKLGLLPWTPQSQLDIVQPCVSELKMTVEQSFRQASDLRDRAWRGSGRPITPTRQRPAAWRR
jgi:hypothetical protein